MDSARWEQIQALFHETLGRPESERQAYLEAASGDDADLMAEVLTMLKADGRTAPLLDRGLPDVAHEMIGAPLDLVPAQEFGPYRLKRILGEGGMGVVWLAEREDAGNLVAIKFLPHAGLSPARRERFAREIKTLGKLKHPFIARLYDAGSLADGTPWFVMEFVDGARFTEYCRKRDGPIEDRLRLFRKVCEAVQYAHGQEIIHRDLKPSNILVEQDGTPRLLDFGIARELQSLDEPADQTRPALRFMSPDYSAPEWARDGSVGFYTDVYSLGVILYELLAGRLPLHRAPEREIEKPSAAHAAAGPSSLGKAAWADLDVLCLKAMHEDAQKRYQSVEALIRDIDHFLKGEPLEARPDTVSYRLRKFVMRNRSAVLAASLAFMLVAGLVVFFTVRLARERDRANHEAAITTAMNRFLSDDLLGRTDPFKTEKAQEPFADVVDRASSRVEVQFSGEPAVSARLHEIIAKAFDNRSDFARARQEYGRAKDLFEKADGPLSEDAVVIRLKLAAMEARRNEQGSLATAQSLLSDCEKSVARLTRPRPDLAVWLQTTRGTIALLANDAHSANENFLAALHLAEALPSFDDARPRMKAFLAISYIRLGDGAKAEPVIRDVIETFSKRYGPDSAETLRARIYLSQALMTQRKYADAIKEANITYPALVRKLGEDHETTMTILGTRAASEGYLGMWDQAIQDDLEVHRSAMRKRGPHAYFALGSLADAALSQCSAGRYREGASNAREALSESRQAFGAHSGQTGGCSYAVAVCLIGMNKLDEASELLGNINVEAVSQLSGEPTVGASIASARGEIAARRGDYVSARRYLRVAAPALERPHAPVSDVQSIERLRKAIDSHSRASW